MTTNNEKENDHNSTSYASHKSSARNSLISTETKDETIIKQQNTKLTGEVAILRQKISILEKENCFLKEKQHNNTKINIRETQKIKKELQILQSENKIKESQIRTYKRPKTDFSITDHKWIIQNVSKDINFDLYPFEYERLKMLNTFFYEEFEKLFEYKEEIKKELFEVLHKDIKLFYKLFALFYSDKDICILVFYRLFCVFVENHIEKDSKNIYKILCYCNFDCIICLADDDDFMHYFNIFLDKTAHEKYSLVFHSRVIERRALLNRIFLTPDRFTAILKNKFDEIELFVKKMPENVLSTLIDKNNVNLVPENDLKRVYKDEYF